MAFHLGEEARKTAKQTVGGTALTILFSLSLCHMLNDIIHALISAIFPLIKESLRLTFAQIGLISLSSQIASSVFQPVVGWYTDRKPQPYLLPIGMGFVLIGVFLLSIAHSFVTVLIAVIVTGLGSSTLHPEASRLAFMASGGKHGFAQSLFQVGGNFGGALGPLLAALIITPFGQTSLAYFCILACIAIVVMMKVSQWYKNNLFHIQSKPLVEQGNSTIQLPRKKVIFAIAILLTLIFSKYVYLSSIFSYYTFYLIEKFHVSTQTSQLYLFIFLLSSAFGTFMGGPIGDRIGRKYVIWGSILGVAPFTLLMPYSNLLFTCILSVLIGFILSSAFSAILVYAQELMPGNLGVIAGFFFGFAFGIGGIASAFFGKVADASGIEFVYLICSYLPLIGLITVFLPSVKSPQSLGTKKVSL